MIIFWKFNTFYTFQSTDIELPPFKAIGCVFSFLGNRLLRYNYLLYQDFRPIMKVITNGCIRWYQWWYMMPLISVKGSWFIPIEGQISLVVYRAYRKDRAGHLSQIWTLGLNCKPYQSGFIKKNIILCYIMLWR